MFIISELMETIPPTESALLQHVKRIANRMEVRGSGPPVTCATNKRHLHKDGDGQGDSVWRFCLVHSSSGM